LVQFRQGKYAAAIAPLASVVRDEPDSEQARYLLGLCQVLSQRFTEAVTTLRPLWDRRSSDVIYLYVLDIAANGAGDKQLDDQTLMQMIRVGSDTPEFHLILGKAYLNRWENPEAIEELKKAIEGNDNLSYAHFELGLAYLRSGDLEHAEPEFRRDIALEPELADNYEQLGILYVRKGER